MRYGGHSSNAEIIEIGQMPKFRSLPDSIKVNSFFDYYRGDYGLDILDLGIRYNTKNQIINVSGFKRSAQGNYGHYIHPTKNSGPIHQSYRIDYSKKNVNDRIEVSAARFISSSGVPDVAQNGFENDNIVSSGIKYEKNFQNWKMNSYLSQFAQNRNLMHSLSGDSISRFINRNQLELQLTNLDGYEFGVIQKSQLFNGGSNLRSIAISSFYVQKYFTDLSIMTGIQLSNNEIYQPYTFLVNYQNNSNIGEFNLSVSSEAQPAHPDVNKSFYNELETKQKSFISYKILRNKLSLDSYFSALRISAKNLYNYSINLFGFNLVYRFNRSWSIYSKSILPAISTEENVFGSIYNTGLKGGFSIFQKNMHINFHIWQDSFTNKKNSFSYDPFLQYYSRSREADFEIGNRNLIHFEVKSNISGVLLHYRVYNLLNAFGIDNTDSFFKPNAIYPELGRMIQFGVTWHFDN